MRRLPEKKCAYLLNKYGQFFRVTFVGKTPKQCKINWNTFLKKRLYCVQTVRHHVNIRLTDKKFHSHQTQQTAQSHRWQSHVGLAPITKKHARQIARKLRAAKRKKMGTHDSINKVCSQFGQKKHTHKQNGHHSQRHQGRRKKEEKL